MSINRRRLLQAGLAATAGAAALAVADRISRRYGLIPPDGGGLYGPGETLTYAAQHIVGAHALAREFPRSMISSAPFANEVPPLPAEFKQQQAAGFKDWHVKVDGMVAHPASFSVADLRALAVRRQITEVACEEGWSYVAEWIGTPLSDVLREAGIQPQARYVVYTSIDTTWWDSMDLADAHHPQTLLTWGMNDGDLTAPFGGPVRMRMPRQLGYKSVKYITHITATDSLKNIGKGLGSASAEGGYAWYAGI